MGTWFVLSFYFLICFKNDLRMIQLLLSMITLKIGLNLCGEESYGELICAENCMNGKWIICIPRQDNMHPNKPWELKSSTAFQFAEEKQRHWYSNLWLQPQSWLLFFVSTVRKKCFIWTVTSMNLNNLICISNSEICDFDNWIEQSCPDVYLCL